jgi:hypothetical protein
MMHRVARKFKHAASDTLAGGPDAWNTVDGSERRRVLNQWKAGKYGKQCSEVKDGQNKASWPLQYIRNLGSSYSDLVASRIIYSAFDVLATL